MKPTLALGILLLLEFTKTTPAHAWSHHYLITEASLRPIPAVATGQVEVSSFESLLKKLSSRPELGFSAATPTAFNEQLQIHRAYRFDFVINQKMKEEKVSAAPEDERPGGQVGLLRLLSMYSDEPDFGMDKELFDTEYPELFRPEYLFMGGKSGTPSQAFRHMVWPFDSEHPFTSLKLPLDKAFHTMGLAPARAAKFIRLARAAYEVDEPYWGARFIANALHYLEDVSQPFHATQVQTPEYLQIIARDNGAALSHLIGLALENTPLSVLLKNPLVSGGFDRFRRQMTNVIAYYHFSFENFIGRVMDVNDERLRAKETERVPLVTALTLSGEPSGSLRYQDSQVQALVLAMAQEAIGGAAGAGHTSIEFFPQIPGPVDSIDPQKMTEQDSFWAQVRATSQGDSPEKKEYFATVEHLFSKLAPAVRGLVLGELGRQEHSGGPIDDLEAE